MQKQYFSAHCMPDPLPRPVEGLGSFHPCILTNAPFPNTQNQKMLD